MLDDESRRLVEILATSGNSRARKISRWTISTPAVVRGNINALDER